VKSKLTLTQALHATNLRLDQQAAGIADLLAALEIQFDRIACMQAELDALPSSRERRKTVRVPFRPSAAFNGGGTRAIKP
jgi:hypothetical protein